MKKKIILAIFGFLLSLTLNKYIKGIVIANQSHIPSAQLRVDIYEVNYERKRTKRITHNLPFNKNNCVIYNNWGNLLPGNVQAVVYSPDKNGDQIKEIDPTFNLSRTQGVRLGTNPNRPNTPQSVSKLVFDRGFKTSDCRSLNQRTQMRYGQRT